MLQKDECQVLNRWLHWESNSSILESQIKSLETNQKELALLLLRLKTEMENCYQKAFEGSLCEYINLTLVGAKSQLSLKQKYAMN